MAPIREIGQAWNRFWFSPADPIGLGVIRILTGSMLVYTHIVWGLEFESMLGPGGWNGPQIVSEFQRETLAPSFWWHVPQAWTMPLHAMSLVVLVLFTLGFLTRLTSVLSMVILVSYSYRAVFSNFGLDQINAILTFYLCVGPSGAALSVDRLIRNRLRSGRWFSRRRAAPRAAANLALRLIQVHFCVVYFYAGVSKLQGDAWWNGEAVWMAFANSEYQTLDMTWIAWYPWVSDLMTHTTVVWEVSFAALVWTRFRPLVLLIGAGMHLGIGGAMGMWTFGLIMVYGHLAFWPPAAFHWLLARVGVVSESGRRTRTAERRPSSVQSPVPSFAAPVAAVAEPALSVLCVDSDRRARAQCLRYFTSRGLVCFTATDAQEALELSDVMRPDAVIVAGRGMDHEALEKFHDPAEITDRQYTVFVLSKRQQRRHPCLGASETSDVFVEAASLGRIRRRIQKHFTRDAVLVPAAESSRSPSWSERTITKPR